MEQEGSNTKGAFEELRSLIVGTTDQRVDRIAEQLENPEQRATDISQVLHQAVSMSASKDGKLAAALQPVTEQTIRDAIRKNPKSFVDVLFPVMGPAIRKSIATTIQGLIQNFNQMLEYGFTLKGWRWRFEALRTRRPFFEVVLMHTLVYQVEQVFLIHRESGLLIEHVAAKTAVAQNPDLVSAMLTAIKDFVQDSFGADQEDTLDTFQVGARKVWIEHGTDAILALVISGNPSVHMTEMMRDALDEIHVTAGDELKSFNGDTHPFEKIRPALSGLLQVQFKSKEDRKPYGAWIVIAIVLLAIGWGLFHWLAQKHHWSQFINRLYNQPGIVITQIVKADGKHHLYGLRDPMAPDDAKLIEGVRISSNSVVFHWEPYQSAYPEYARRRLAKLFKPPVTVTFTFASGVLNASGTAFARWMEDTRRLAGIVPWIDRYNDSDLVAIDQRLRPPPSVTLDLRGTTLHASGRAPQPWIAATRSAVKSLPGITAYDDRGLTDPNYQEWEKTVRVVETSTFYFKSGSNALTPGQEGAVKVLVNSVKQLTHLSAALERPLKIDIIGYADRTGTEKRNLVLSHRRAQAFMTLLAAADIDKTYFALHAAGSQNLIHPETDAANRCVRFKVQAGD